MTLLHQCKGHARSVEALDVCSDKSKVCLSVHELTVFIVDVVVLFTTLRLFVVLQCIVG